MSVNRIGIFDSGFGGLTVMKEIAELLPHENIIYFGDTARLPYGNKNPETILKYSKECIEFLEKKGIKLLVIACHSACTTSHSSLSRSFPFPILGVSKPGVEEITKHAKNHAAVLGTQATIGSNVYQKLILAKNPSCEITAIACPLFVPIVETGYVHHSFTKIIIKDHLKPLKEAPDLPEAVLLACTHYPLLKSLIQEELGPNILLIDPAKACAEHVRKELFKANLLNNTKKTPSYEFYVSDDPTQFRKLGQQFLPHAIEHVFSHH